MFHVKIPVLPSVSDIVSSDFSSGKRVRGSSFSQESPALASISMLMFDPVLGTFITQPQVTMTLHVFLSHLSPWQSPTSLFPQSIIIIFPLQSLDLSGSGRLIFFTQTVGTELGLSVLSPFTAT